MRARALAALLPLAEVVTLLVLESRRPLRVPTQPKLRRGARNVAVAAVAGAAVALTERPMTSRLTRLVAHRRWGFVHLLPLPAALRTALAVVLMDYTLYVWHWLTHRSPTLWRFHAAHHVDRDLDASTALRFHFGELVASVPWRAAQIVAIGVTPRALSIWQAATMLAILFHHSNVRLPLALERVLAIVVVTPRMHGIHHSIVDDERASNWSTILSFADRLHGTFRFCTRDAITVGLPRDRAAHDPTLGEVLGLPLAT